MKLIILLFAFLFFTIADCYCAGDYLIINFKDNTSRKILIDSIKAIKIVNTTGVEDPVISSGIKLIGNFPNPFQQATHFEIELEYPVALDIIIYNNTGSQLRKLTFTDCSAGTNLLPWDGNDMNGSRLQSGVYFYEVHCGKDVISKKMLLIN